MLTKLCDRNRLKLVSDLKLSIHLALREGFVLARISFRIAIYKVTPTRTRVVLKIKLNLILRIVAVFVVDNNYVLQILLGKESNDKEIIQISPIHAKEIAIDLIH